MDRKIRRLSKKNRFHIAIDITAKTTNISINKLMPELRKHLRIWTQWTNCVEKAIINLTN